MKKPSEEFVTSDATNKGFVVAIDAFEFGGGVSIKRLVGMVWAARYLVILSGLIGGAGGLVASYLVTPRYEVSTTLVWAGSENGNGLLSGLGGQLSSLVGASGLLSGGEAQQDEAIAVIKSRLFTDAFIAENDLLPILYSGKWDADKGEWRDAESGDLPTTHDAFRFFDKNVRSVSQDARGGLIHITMRWTDGELAADWANRLVARANEVLKEQRIVQARASLDFLRQELENQNNIEIRNSIFRMMESQLNAVMIAQVRPDFAFRVIDPAMSPDEDDFNSPNRLVFLVAGGLLGGFIALLFTWIRSGLRD